MCLGLGLHVVLDKGGRDVVHEGSGLWGVGEGRIFVHGLRMQLFGLVILLIKLW